MLPQADTHQPPDLSKCMHTELVSTQTFPNSSFFCFEYGARFIIPCFYSPFTVPDDFNAINQALSYPPGTVPGSAAAQQCFFLSPTPDQCIEDQEDIIVQLSSTNDIPFTVGGNQAGIYINDDDSTWPACLAIFEGKRESGCETQVGGKEKLHGGCGTLR